MISLFLLRWAASFLRLIITSLSNSIQTCYHHWGGPSTSYNCIQIVWSVVLSDNVGSQTIIRNWDTSYVSGFGFAVYYVSANAILAHFGEIDFFTLFHYSDSVMRNCNRKVLIETPEVLKNSIKCILPERHIYKFIKAPRLEPQLMDSSWKLITQTTEVVNAREIFFSTNANFQAPLELTILVSVWRSSWYHILVSVWRSSWYQLKDHPGISLEIVLISV